jgi:hypothetical protein
VVGRQDAVGDLRRELHGGQPHRHVDCLRIRVAEALQCAPVAHLDRHLAVLRRPGAGNVVAGRHQGVEERLEPRRREEGLEPGAQTAHRPAPGGLVHLPGGRLRREEHHRAEEVEDERAVVAGRHRATIARPRARPQGAKKVL